MNVDSIQDAGKVEPGRTKGRPRKITKAQLRAAIYGSGGRRGL
jgi:hypothetical protein